MSRNAVITAVVVIIVILGGWYLLRPKQPASSVETTVSTPTETQNPSPAAASEGAAMAGETMVTVTASGFSPKDVTIKAGETVTWVNNDTVAQNVSSDPHPTHTTYPPLNLGNIEPGGKVSLKFPAAGVYKYHDHLIPSLRGSVTVQ